MTRVCLERLAETVSPEKIKGGVQEAPLADLGRQQA